MVCRWLVVTGLLILGASLSPAQEDGKLGGRVTDAETGGSIARASIILSETQQGTVTDEDGTFLFPALHPGKYSITISHVGYLDGRVENIDVRRGERIHHEIKLFPSPVPVEGVEVTGSSVQEHSYASVGVLSVQPERSRTLAGVGEDVFRTLQALPGVLSPNDFSSQLIIRGSGPDQNLIVLDDIEIYNPYRLYGMISIFNPEAVSSITLTSGGFPVKYGDRLSAVLDVRSKSGDRSRTIGGSINASITNANLFLHGGNEDLNLSYSISARRTYYDLILGPIAKSSGLVQGDVAFPNFTDIQGKIVVEPMINHQFTITGLAGKDAVSLISGEERDRPDSVSVRDNTRNEAFGLGWTYVPAKNLLSSLTLSYYRNRGDADFQGSFLDPSLNRELFDGGDTLGVRLFNAAFTSLYAISKYSALERFSWALPSHLVEVGIGFDHIQSSFAWVFDPDETFRAILATRNVAFPEEILQETSYNKLSMYAQDLINLGDRISITPGIRYDYFTFINKGVFQPRVSLGLVLSDLTRIQASTGIYYQSPGYERLRDQERFYDFTHPSVRSLNPEKAIHYVLGVEHWITHEWQFRAESYFKDFDELLNQTVYEGTVYETDLIAGSNPRDPDSWEAPRSVQGDSITTVPDNGGTGKSFGIEFLLQKINAGPGNRLSGWVSYALARAERTERGVVTPFRYDQRHTVNIVLDYRLNGWLDLGMRWRYGTNFPYTPPVGLTPRIIEVTVDGDTQAIIQTDQDGNVIFDLDRGSLENRGSRTLPPYHRLDLRLTAGADYWDLDWKFYLDVINVYNRENVIAYQFYVNDDLTIGRNDVSMLPILPTLGVSVTF